MRVTTLQNRERQIAQLLRGQERLEEARNQVASGRRIQRPSDSPGEIAELLRARTQIADLEQRRASADTFLPYMKASETALGEIAGAVREIRVLALQANNGTINPEQRQSLGDQVQRLRGRVRDLANTRVDGRYLFAGTNTLRAPFVSGSPITYAGNDTPIQASLVADTLFDVSITGDALMNVRAPSGSSGPTDLFQNLEALEAAIRSGDSGQIAAGLTVLDEDLDQLLRLRGDMGARIQYVEAMQRRIAEDLAAAQEWQSRLQDVDLATAILEAQAAETAHEATLLVASRLEQPSLLDLIG
jgi:flagellar hook-associated protein 3 FlgL